MRRSVRCEHGFCLATVGCEQCGVRPGRRAAAHLLRVPDPKRLPNPSVPEGYDNTAGVKYRGGRRRPA